MKVIGITGGIGAGKSAVLEILSEVDGSFTLEADKAAHSLMEPGNIVYEKIIDFFGRDILDEELRIDRSRLGKIVLGDEGNLMVLNSIVHPAVKEYIKGDISVKREDGLRYYFIEAALLIQDGYRAICDEIWFISADRDIRIDRLIQNRGYSREKAESFLKNQPDDSFFLENSDVVIDNSGTKEELKSRIFFSLM